MNAENKKMEDDELQKQLGRSVRLLFGIGAVVFIVLMFLLNMNFIGSEKSVTPNKTAKSNNSQSEFISLWEAPSLDALSDTTLKSSILYGKELIAHTSKYLGPKGSVLQISNGLNCQNCHLEAGTKPYGNNYGSVASTYPKFRARSGSSENIYKRVNDLSLIHI